MKQKLYDDGGSLCKSLEKSSGARFDYEEMEDGKILLMGSVEETSKAFKLIAH